MFAFPNYRAISGDKEVLSFFSDKSEREGDDRHARRLVVFISSVFDEVGQNLFRSVRKQGKSLRSRLITPTWI
jgi:hypothetical protein